MTEDKQKLATTLYEITDDLILESPDSEDISIDKLLTPQQKYSLIMSIVNGLPKDSLEQVIDFNNAFSVAKETTQVVDRFQYRELRFTLIAEELCELGFAMGLSENVIYKLLIQNFVRVRQKQPTTSIVEIVDALTDLLVVVYGAFYVFNLIPVQLKAMEEVYTSNMSKLIPHNTTSLRDITESVTELKQKGLNVVSKDLGENGTAIFNKDTGKLLKPTTFVEPDLKSIINKYLKNK